VFPNGHKLMLDRAVEALGHPALRAHYDALLLGCLREDFWNLAGWVVRGKGFTHFAGATGGWGLFVGAPGAPRRAGRLFQRAVREHRAGRTRDAFFWLGRAAHLVGEMAAPVHAGRCIHWRGDAFESYLEAHGAELWALPVAELPSGRTAAQLAADLAARARAFPADRTRNLRGFLAWKMGRLRRPSADEVLAQVRALVPLGVASLAALCRRFLSEVGER
jgi:hypothetical protein